ncbi:MAG: hypothetical protein JWQ30_1539 [Sediminibacterium sp.]|nr:hypothetical protein [Sediminibacterium sp.]
MGSTTEQCESHKLEVTGYDLTSSSLKECCVSLKTLLAESPARDVRGEPSL